eukprot:TRINITY_DN4011_c1_g1_i1.p1 TRINITY_DN4011_c1_g1~~TRINITY_DN4011_c1_g1_i1.p1  ORF type:complete len:221 (-),score=15.99 TRINITY_DN4011_c1_g1_i1:172-834(-)
MVIRVYNIVDKEKRDTRSTQQLVLNAVRLLQPIDETPWQRSAKLFSQRKVGVDDDTKLAVSFGILPPVWAYESGSSCVLCYKNGTDSSARTAVSNGGALAMLKGMQYNELKEIMYKGVHFSFGNVAAIAGNMQRRTNDLHPIGSFLALEVTATASVRRAQALLDDFAQSILRHLRSLVPLDVPLPMDLILANGSDSTQTLGDINSAEHEAFSFLTAASVI